MKQSHTLTWFIALSGLVLAPASRAAMAPPIQIAGVTCETPPPLHCPDSDCPSATVTEQGTAIEPKTGRKFFLDYPCDLKRGEKVTFVLSLHGGGSYGNWQRHYFPIVDYKDKYRLVIATPNAPPRVWAATDDEYLQNIVNLVYEQLGKNNIKAFWLVGHSQGGMTSNRIVRTDFFKNRVDGWLSLSGGRLGGTLGRGSFGALLRGGPPAAGRAGAPDAGRAGCWARRSAGRRSRWWTGRLTSGAHRASGERFLVHLRNGRTRNGRQGPSGELDLGREKQLWPSSESGGDSRCESRLRL
jgi:hypothetical protein